MFFGQKKSEDLTLILDIGGISVGAALVSAAKGVAPKIVFSTRVHIAARHTSNRAREITHITAALESVMKSVMAQAQPIKRSHVIFSSPWYSSKSEVIKIHNDQPTLIKPKTVAQLTKEAEQRFINESEQKSEVVERRIISSKVNGYETIDPFEKKAKTVEITFFVSMVESDLLNAVRSVVEKHFHVYHSQFSSFSLAAWSAISGLMPDEHDFLIVDVRGEVTDVSLVAGGALKKSLYFPKGKNSLIRSVSASTDESLATAQSAIKTALHGYSQPEAQSRIMKATNNFKHAWLSAYTESLQTFSADGAVPKKVFLLADVDIDVFFENILNALKKDGGVHPLKHLDVRQFVETSSVLTDPFLALESIFVTML